MKIPGKGAVKVVLATLTITARHGHTPTLMGIESMYFYGLHVYAIV